MNKRVLFYASIPDKKLFEITGFYKTDISILRDLGYKVFLSNSFKDVLRFWNYDISFIYFWTRGVIPAFVSKLFHKKVIFTGGLDSIDQEYNKSNWDYNIKKILFKLCTIFSDANIIVSETDLKNIRKTGYSTNNIHLIHHVIDLKKYEYDYRVKENIITTIAWMETVGNVQRKGVDKLLYVFKKFLQMNNQFKLVIIGTMGPGAKYLQEIARELNISGKIIFTGSISEQEKIDYLKNSKIYFQLSEYEGFGIAAIEALAAGNIVFHSGKGALSYTISSFGIEVKDTTDYQHIAHLLNNICITYQNYSNFIQQGIEHVKNNFSYNFRKDEINILMNDLNK